MLPLELFKGEVNCWRNCLGFPPFLLRALRRGRKRACILNVRIFWECWPLVLASRSSVSYIKQIGFLEETFFFFVLFFESSNLHFNRRLLIAALRPFRGKRTLPTREEDERSLGGKDLARYSLAPSGLYHTKNRALKGRVLHYVSRKKGFSKRAPRIHFSH